MSKAGHILLVDRERRVGDAITAVLRRPGWSCHALGDARQVADALRKDAPDVLVVDLGVAAYRKLLARRPKLPPSLPVLAVTSAHVALSYGWRAAWSQPLLSKDQQVLGTFGMYYVEPRTPSATDLRLIEGAGHIAVIAIEGERSQAALTRAFEEITKSEAELRAIQPVVDGVDVREIESIRSGDFGYVAVLVPASDTGPHRAMLKNGGDREFWKRSGDSFYRMELFDIADMFGRRRRPMLVLTWRVSLDRSPDDQRVFKWSLILGLSNEGRALARYPMLDLVCPLEAAPDTRYGLDGNGREGLSRRPVVGAVKDKKVRALYVGDAGTVIHPGTDLDIAKTVSLEGIAYADRRWSFKPATLNLRYRISAEDFPVVEDELALDYNEFVDALRSPLGF